VAKAGERASLRVAEKCFWQRRDKGTIVNLTRFHAQQLALAIVDGCSSAKTGKEK
jgi:hypothetical protein